MAWHYDEKYTFTATMDGGATASHDVYVKGDGPPILLLQELPGIGDDTYGLADRLIAAGFTVYLPHLLGRLGSANRLTTFLNAARLFCVRREINIFLHGRQSPIAGWMRALCADISTRCDGQKLGVVGMCMTGHFAIVLMAEDAVTAAVGSQPALPFRADTKVQISPAEVAATNAAMTQKGCAMAMRYEGDKISRPAHLKALKDAFGDNLETHEFAGDGHSLLTLDFNGEAYNRVEQYFLARVNSV